MCHIFYSEEDGGYIAVDKDIGVSAFGNTPDEARSEFGIARGLFLSVENEDV